LVFSKEDLENPNSSAVFNLLKNSTNPKITNLTYKLLDALKQVDITDLQPLERVMEDRLDNIANAIIQKF
jgi:hypothetical protein